LARYNAADSPDALQTVRIVREELPVGRMRNDTLVELNLAASALTAAELFLVFELLVTNTSITTLDLSGAWRVGVKVACITPLTGREPTVAARSRAAHDGAAAAGGARQARRWTWRPQTHWSPRWYPISRGDRTTSTSRRW
jgi:hypothetical protein